MYSPVVQWAPVRLMFVFQCILGFQSQIIYLKNEFDQVDITREEQVFIEIPRYFNSDRVQCDIFLRLKKSLHGQSKYTRLWYERLWNGLSVCGFVARKADTWLFMSKNVSCMVYVDDYLFWVRSKSNIEKAMKSFKEYGPSYNWEHWKGDSVS